MQRTWIYTWKSSDGFRHEGEMQSPDKDSVYAELRKRGIHAIKVTERIQPIVRRGFSGLRKRDWGVIAVAATALAVALSFVLDHFEPAPPPPTAATPADDHPNATALRHFIDIPQGIDLDYYFTDATDRLFARYAIPGELITPGPNRTLDESAIAELRAIVRGMHAEAMSCLVITNGAARLLAFLDERQQMEMSYRRQLEYRVNTGALAVSEANAILSAMAMRPIPAK